MRKLVFLVFLCISSFANAEKSYVVGTWNLEHFHQGAKRGFPETSISARKKADVVNIANIIKALNARILLLQEINGELMQLVDEDGEAYETNRSEELDGLIAILGDNYDYVIAESGGSQRIAILYDSKFAQLNDWCETSFTNTKVDGKGLFDRQPVYAHFTLLEDGKEKNDLVVVGVHLASGQMHFRNHDRAMRRLVKELDAARAEEFCIPSNEFDVLIAGDFNANRFDTKYVEKFWNEMENDGWDVLGDDGDTYSATRMSGKPLQLRTSQIDYIIVSKGLAGEEVTASTPTIHKDLITTTPVEFRRRASDHLPVTVNIRVIDDND